MMNCFRDSIGRVETATQSILWVMNMEFVVLTSELARIPWASVKSLQVHSKTNERVSRVSIELVDTQIPVGVFKTLLLMKSMKMRWLSTKVKWKPFKPIFRSFLTTSLRPKKRRLASSKLLENSWQREKSRTKSRKLLFKKMLNILNHKVHMLTLICDEI